MTRKFNLLYIHQGWGTTAASYGNKLHETEITETSDTHYNTLKTCIKEAQISRLLEAHVMYSLSTNVGHD